MRMEAKEQLIDGWKNSAGNTKNVVAIIRLTDGRYLFLDLWNFSSVEESGENLAEIVEYSIEIALQRYNVTIYAVVSDNASNVISMGNLTELWNVTCNSHSGNLYAKFLVTEDRVLVDKVNSLAKEFKTPKLEDLLLKKGGKKMTLIVETRWCSHRDTYRK